MTSFISPLLNDFSADLACRHREGLSRTLSQSGSSSVELTIDLLTNDYLDLSRSPRVRERLRNKLQEEVDFGAKASRLLGGNHPAIESCEWHIAQLYRVPRVLLMTSGYVANLAVVSTLASTPVSHESGPRAAVRESLNAPSGSNGVCFFSDELMHASFIDGIRMTRHAGNIGLRLYRHLDLQHLEDLLKASRARRRVILTESVFSMDGDRAPLVDLVALAERFGAWLVVDEAHATGVLGPRSLGATDGYRSENLITVHTAGKALGAQGAWVSGPAVIIESLVHKARSFIYSTGLSPLLAWQIQFALDEVANDPACGSRLLAKSAAFCDALGPIGASTGSSSQIVPVHKSGNQEVIDFAAQLASRGIQTAAVRAPTVAPGRERVRLAIKQGQSEVQLARVAQIIREVY